MSAASTRQATIEASSDLPTITITREFDAPRDRVFRAWVEPELVARWLGPRDGTMRIDAWESRTGGAYRYSAAFPGEDTVGFYGSFHEVRPEERIVWTFTWEGMPDGVALETMTFDDIGDGRTRVTSVSLMESMQARDGMLSSGMEVGVHEGYAQLDELLAEG